jgi:hypothetical protein
LLKEKKPSKFFCKSCGKYEDEIKDEENSSIKVASCNYYEDYRRDKINSPWDLISDLVLIRFNTRAIILSNCLPDMTIAIQAQYLTNSWPRYIHIHNCIIHTNLA